MTITLETIQDYARRIAERFNPVKIILYGSYAYGHPTEASDLDLLVIMNYEGHCLDIARSIKRALDLPSYAHLLVKPPEEVAWRYTGGEALNKGKVLYERPATGHL